MPGRTHCIACGTALSVGDVQMQVPETPAVQPAQIMEVTTTPPPLDMVPTQPIVTPTISVLPSEPFASPIEPELPLPAAPIPQKESTEEVQSGGVGREPSWLEPTTAESEPSFQVPEPTPAITPATPEKVSTGDASPRVNVQYDAEELAEVPMPIHHEVPNSAPSQMVPGANQSENTPEEVEEHAGPWLALTVIGMVLVGIVLILYFLYQWLSTDSVQPTTVPTPTVIQTTIPSPTITQTPALQLSSDDGQREKDINDLQTALAAYYREQQRYPGAATYNGLLNTLIGSGYVTRRIQDPVFPVQEYGYSVDSTGQSYDITITFDSIASTLLSGARSPVYKLRGTSGN